MIFFGAVSVVAGALTLILPETKNCLLPSSLNDAKKTTG
ncbi:unnamed protein product [Gongylonema pulchrum]|uniref:MFS domain-containing protein n=1 Tax=Gongylonema pulchrum TaxID=637853 RepID=A0A183EMF9_9BILA|nr:unnamed protein product [Gongylonema pulchrum]